ncbi:MAG TPA: hypothetical protein VF437_11420 [Verrucomicrobiae bacterium]
MKNKFFALAIFTALLWQVRAAIPAVEKILPDDTLFVFTVPDVDKLRDVYKTSPQTRFWNDPAMKPFKEKFMAKWNEAFVTPLERELSIHFDDYISLPHGQIAFAITRGGLADKNDKKAGAVFLVDTKDKSAQLRTNLANLRKKWVDAGKTMQTEKLHDIEFMVFTVTAEDMPKTLKNFFSNPEDSTPAEGGNKSTGDQRKIFIGQSDSLLIVGNNAKAVDSIATRLIGSGSAPVLADVSAFEADRTTLFRDAPFYAWLNVRAITDLAINQADANKDSSETATTPTPAWKKAITATGLSGLKSVALSYHFIGDGYMMDIFLRAPESTRQGLLKLIAGEPKESSPPPFVPADAIKFQRWRLDGQKAWATLEKMVNDISPSAMNSINFVIESANAAAREKDPDFDLRKKLIGNLGNDIVTYQKAPRDMTLAALNSPPSIFLIGSPNPEQVVGALQGFLRLMNPSGPTEREFLGRKIYTASLPLNPLGGAGGSASFSYAASAGYVAMSGDNAILEEYLRSSENPPKALRDAPGLADAAQRVAGTSTGWFGYQNQSETMRTVFEVLRKSAGATNSLSSDSFFAAFAGIPGVGNNLKDWMDFSLLPAFEKVSKYFYFTVFANSTSVDGLTFKVFAPLPPQLKK